MVELTATFENGIPVVDSRLIAERLGIQHQKWINNTVKKYMHVIESDGSICLFKIFKSPNGRNVKYYLLNEEQAYFLLTLSRNTPKVIELKRQLVKAYLRAKETYGRLLEQHKNIIASEILLPYPKLLVKVFPNIWFESICKSRNWPWNPKKNKPQAMAWVINTQCYDRLSDGIVTDLEMLNPRNPETKERDFFHHQFLKNQKGIPELQALLQFQINICKVVDYSWDKFLIANDKVYPKQGRTLSLPFPLDI